MPFQPCIIIPIYNNRQTIRDVVASVESAGLPCLIVDDGSDDATREVLDAIGREHASVDVLRLPQNRGKGAAMRAGFDAAAGRGFTHAVQVDADGQHDARDIPRFLAAARDMPTALVLADPEFGDDAPASRRYGRLVTTFFVWIETLSFDIRDTLCGYRCYPLAAVQRVYQTASIGDGMVFDTELAVHLYWAGTPVTHVSTRITYAPGGLSHFRYAADNLRISWMHCRLLAGMLKRLPRLVGRRRHSVPGVAR